MKTHYVCRYYGDSRYGDPKPRLFHHKADALEYLLTEEKEWRADGHVIQGDALSGYVEISTPHSDRTLALNLAECECDCP